jgi:hypothetical protein
MATGVTGITGTQGLQGLRGLRGDPYGPTGPAFQYHFKSIKHCNSKFIYYTTYTFKFRNVLQYHKQCNIKWKLNIDFSFVNSIYPETNELFPTPEQSGSFWVIRNNYSAPLTIALSNGTANQSKFMQCR